MTVDTCRCGHEMVPAVRYDAEGQHETWACFRGAPACVNGLRPPRHCTVCDTRLGSKQERYCSLACYATTLRTSVELVCPCGKPFTVPPSQRMRGRGKYCSVSCGLRYRVRHAASVRMAS